MFEQVFWCDPFWSTRGPPPNTCLPGAHTGRRQKTGRWAVKRALPENGSFALVLIVAMLEDDD